jgi:aspartate racemase
MLAKPDETMKTIGIVGGIGPESTVDYYKLLIAAYLERRSDDSYPQVIINSVDMRKLVRIMNANDLTQLVDWLVAEVQKLANAGAEIGLVASNTPHIVFDELSSRSAIPLVSIVEATCEAAQKMRLTKLGLFGSRFTMQSRFYADVFSRKGIEVVVPAQDEQAWIHAHYMDELVYGIFLAETRDRFIAIAQRIRAQDGIQALILGGTELPLLLRDVDCGIPYLDTAKIHVDAVMAAAMV